MADESAELAELLERLRAGEDAAAEELWKRYFHRIVRLAAKRLPGTLRRTRDEEDVALSAFHSFVAGVQADRFPDLAGPDNLWGLLIVLTSRKVQAHLRHHTRQKRGGGKVRGESVFLAPDAQQAGAGISGVEGTRGEPALEAEMTEAVEGLLESLGEPDLREIAVLRMEGYLVDEIAAQLEMSKRAVERRLQLIRKVWTESERSEPEE
jgi:DNA-directed RNA polymerase specialized sigma24 family protein